jgi:transcription-repair coupling factor (superfamily II helicase)
MQLSGLLDILRQSAVYHKLLARLKAGDPGDDLRVIRSARPYMLAALASDWDGPVIYLTARVDRAYNVTEQLPVWLPEAAIYRFAEPSPLFYDRAPWGDNVQRSRIAALAALLPPDDFDSAHTQPIIVASARAIMQRTLPVNPFRKESLILRPGVRIQLDRLLEQCVRLGYTPASLVVEPGTFTRRGGLVDIFPIAADAPVRIDFFDDEIESLRLFDPANQRSQAHLPLVVITPAREVLAGQTPPLAEHLRSWFDTLPPADQDATSPRSDQEALRSGAPFPYLEYYLPYLYPRPVSLLDYAPDNALIVIEDWSELRDTVAGIEEAAVRNRAEKLAANLLPPDYPLPYITWDALVEELNHRTTAHFGFGTGDTVETLFSPEDLHGGQLRQVVDHLRKLRAEREARVIVVTAQAPRLGELWHEQAAFIPTVKDIPETPQPGSLWFVNGTLQEGWALRTENSRVHLVTDHEIFGWNRPEPRRRRVTQRARVPETGYADLKEGDYVVHVDYGIGRFAGMRRRTVEGNEREYLVVEYAGTDMVFVPVHQADRLTRYVGADDTTPQLNSLGKPDWQRTHARAKQAVEEEARELLELYARRSQAFREPFNADNHWQHELEASFPYVETEDQLRAVREVKEDMQRAYPMDRLICGDVGYGKTEVALRAAFKAVLDGKQVAVLVPTTVLAQQHYETFGLRLTRFPVKVEMLSRFRTREEQNRLLPKIASGEIDIIIGTHRLLSEDVTFKDLGLVIIDEEQRFGVTHKEHFKKLRTQVDVLTLTATPIPRTLYMSLAGVRDISMIQTPPEERLPVITHVGAFDEALLRQAVLRELDRGGQIFFVHNRVQSIEAARDRLERVVPELRTIIAHGQMHERTLEKVMVAFGRGDYDALVCTSIIESGIDIPNANTLIVDRADWFGMGQLYQLRGRVGRSAQQAYAYFFHAGAGRLTDEARMRLETLAENTQLGAGFQIAMRDLELRGAGDILSTRQTGHVAAIGLHLYTQLLADAVQRLKGEVRRDNTPAAVLTNIPLDLPLPAYLPTAWIPEMELRLQIYRRMAGLTNAEDVSLMRDELRDRFGALPQAVENLLYQIDVKLLAQAAGATAIIAQNGEVQIRLPYLPEINRDALQRALGADVTVSRTAVAVPIGERETWQLVLLDVLTKLARAATPLTEPHGL